MTDRDPSIRDGWAYNELASGISAGKWRDELANICETTLTHFRHPEVQARAFAPLVCRWLLNAGERNRSIFDACAAWYVAEDDVRGFDPELGWLHAVAHGADCLGSCATAGIARGDEVLAVLATRVTRESPVWGSQEAARIATAVLAALVADPATKLAALFDPINLALTHSQEHSTASDSTAPPRWHANVEAVAQTLYVCANEPVMVDGQHIDVPQRDELGRRAIALTRRMLVWLLI